MENTTETIKITENDMKFLKSVVDYESDVKKVQRYIKENYNVESRFDEKTLTLSIYSNDVNESLGIVNASEYAKNEIGEDRIIVKLGLD